MNEKDKQNRAGGSPLLCSGKMLVTNSSPECVTAGVAGSWWVGRVERTAAEGFEEDITYSNSTTAKDCTRR